MTRKLAEEATKWANERDERLAHIARLQKEYTAFAATCKHWSHTEHKNELEGYTIERCEWCGKEWERE